MKKIKTALLVILTAFTISSCGGGTEPANAEGFRNLENKLKEKFGDKAYYTKITVSYVKSIGNVLSVTVTDDPKSLKMGEWNFTNGEWKQTAEVTLEAPEGKKADDFMFQFGDKIIMSKLGELVEKSMEVLKNEKSIEPELSVAFIKFPQDGDISKAEYAVTLKPKTGGTSFTYFYQLDGTFIEMNH